MFRRYVSSIYVFRIHVSSVFIWMLHMFHTYVACILFGCLRMVAMVFKCFLDVFSSVLEACFNYFNCH
jgi:hypothetical protein